MDISKIKFGESAELINVIIEIPAGNSSVKYEFDKDSGAIYVDRILEVAMYYPMHYGFIPNTLAGDGDPIDVLVYCYNDLVPGCVIKCTPIGVLLMEDESGMDEKILAIPSHQVDSSYSSIKNYTDLPKVTLDRVKHFFEKYKDLTENKWAKVQGFADKAIALKKIEAACNNYKKSD